MDKYTKYKQYRVVEKRKEQHEENIIHLGEGVAAAVWLHPTRGWNLIFLAK
jgi:hypothetical protein